MSDLEQFKRVAAELALDDVRSGMRLGLGTGSTARYVVLGLAARLRDGRLHDVVGVPTSEATAALARAEGVPLATLDACPVLNLTIDGADEIDPELHVIKGLGGALLREKIVAAASHALTIVADTTKIVQQLGTRAPLPVEVVPFAVAPVRARLANLGCETSIRHSGDAPFFTDERNLIVDCRWPGISDPFALDRALHSIPGVVEHGMFLGMAGRALIAGPTGTEDRRVSRDIRQH